MASRAGIEFEREADAFAARLASTLGTVNAATGELVDLVVESLERRWWEAHECLSPEQWVAVCFGMSPARAHRLVRIARALPSFPKVAALFRAGQVTEDHLDVIARHAHPDHDTDLEIAGCCSTGQLRRFIASLPVPDPDDPEPVDDDEPTDESPEGSPPADDEPDPDRDRVHGGWGEDGRYRLGIDAGPVLGSLLEQALKSARNACYRRRHGRDTVDDSELSAVTGPEALEVLARAALDQLDPSTARGGPASERHQVFIHLDAEHPERSRIHLGPLLPRSVAEELLCDAELRAVLWRDGRPVGLGRKHRVADTLLRKLIEDRDGGCRAPGCERTGYLHIHHIVHWPAGGPTDPDNLVALCTEHHRAVHRRRLRIVGNPETRDGLTFLTASGRPLPRPAPGPPGPAPAIAEPYRGPERGRFSYGRESTVTTWF